MKAEEVIKKRMKRNIAICMNVIEREVYPLLDQVNVGSDAKQKLRKVILDQFNDLCEIAVDIATTGEADEFAFNADVFDRQFEKLGDRLVEAVERIAPQHVG